MKSKIALLVAGLCVSTAIPALADWDNVGRVEVGFHADRDARNLDLGGPVERLQLSADRSDVYCNAVTAHFGSGNSRRVFQGIIRNGRSVRVDMPGTAVDLNRLVFNCAAQGRRGATIGIAADIGRYRDTWRRSPNWSRMWAHMFGWANNNTSPPSGGAWRGNPPPGGAMTESRDSWALIGTETLEGRYDRETVSNGWHGRPASKIGLSAVNTDARCMGVAVRFSNGQAINLHMNFDVMRRGQIYSLDLPGQVRDVARIALRCHAVDNRRVTFQIFTR